MKFKTTCLAAVCLLVLTSTKTKAQIQTKIGSTLNTLPAASVDALRTSNGLISHLVSGTVGGFGATDQWIGTGAPVAALYGERTQWNGQAFSKALRSQNPANPAAVKDAIIEWGNLGGEMQFRYVTNPLVPTGNIKIHTLTSAGNAYYGITAPPIFFGTPKVGINTTDQPGLNVTSVNKVSVFTNQIRTTSVNAGILGIGSYAYTNSTSTNNSNYGMIGYSQGTGAGTTNFGVYGIASGLATGTNYGVYGNAPVGANSWAGYFSGNVFCTGFYIGSDSLLKINVKAEENMLDRIMQVHPVNYNYDYERNPSLNLSPELQHGFLAQDIARVFPEMVKTSRYSIPDENGVEKESQTYLSLNYVGLISILYRGIQEQQEQINLLNEKLGITKNSFAAKNGEPAPGNAFSTATELTNAADKKIVTRAGTFSVTDFSMAQNVPNPFSVATTISYRLPAGVKNASIAVFDMTGKMLLQYNGLNGSSQVTIQGNSLTAGLYYYSLMADGQEVMTKRMILTK